MLQFRKLHKSTNIDPAPCESLNHAGGKREGREEAKNRRMKEVKASQSQQRLVYFYLNFHLSTFFPGTVYTIQKRMVTRTLFFYCNNTHVYKKKPTKILFFRFFKSKNIKYERTTQKCCSHSKKKRRFIFFSCF